MWKASGTFEGRWMAKLFKSIQVSLWHSCWRRSNSMFRWQWTTSARNAFPRRTVTAHRHGNDERVAGHRLAPQE